MKYIEILRQNQKDLETAQIEVQVEQASLVLQQRMLETKRQMLHLNQMSKELRQSKPLDFDALLENDNEFALAERQMEQFKKLQNELF